MSYSDLLLRDGRNVNAGPFLDKSLAEVEEIVISSANFEGSQLVRAGYKIGVETLGGVGLRVRDLHLHNLL